MKTIIGYRSFRFDKYLYNGMFTAVIVTPRGYNIIIYKYIIFSMQDEMGTRHFKNYYQRWIFYKYYITQLYNLDGFEIGNSNNTYLELNFYPPSTSSYRD